MGFGGFGFRALLLEGAVSFGIFFLRDFAAFL